MAEFGFETPLGPRVTIAGRERDYFSGTGYLGLHNHPEVTQAAIQAIQRYGMSTATSRGGYGEHVLFDQLEAEARLFFGCERVLYYSSGYMGAAVLAQGLRESYERAFVDQASHYSIFEGLRGADKPLVTFRHADPQALREALRSELRPGERPLLLSDGLFPISGEIAPVPAFLDELRAYPGALLALDDAHAAGVLGANGRGTLEHYALQSPDCFGLATLSKALGGFGGLLPGPENALREISRLARPLAGASPAPLPAAAASAAALRIARTRPGLRDSLRANIRQVRLGLRAAGWELEDSPSPIVCLPAQAGRDLAKIKAVLFERGICVAHVTSYSSTPAGGALRIAVFSTHSPEQIQRLVEALGQV